MNATACKIIDFPASHQNLHHPGKCARVHGHTWTLEIYVTGQVEMDPNRDDYGMVCDFGRIKTIYAEEIEPFVEHQHLNDTISVLTEYTSELIAAWILEKLHKREPRVTKVRLWEGKSSFVEVTVGDLLKP